jgi:hypothetical protein
MTRRRSVSQRSRCTNPLAARRSMSRVIAPASMSMSRASSCAVHGPSRLSFHSGYHCAAVRSCAVIACSTWRRIEVITWLSR